ncbi:MAG TPA: hypothetical protein VH593_07685 [Ktedonobacteraceae bacterium]|jgi:hypothetical protein
MFDFTKNGGSSSTSSSARSRMQAPDQTTHQAPGCLITLGALVILVGTAGLCWQVFTTFSALWALLNPPGVPINYQAQPVIFIMCALISVSFEFALLMLVWRIDTAWKKRNAATPGDKEGRFKSLAVEVVQHVDLMMVWGALGFIVDTVGDFLFVSLYAAHAGATYEILFIFLYVVSLYAVTTIGYVRAWEYVWAGLAVSRNIMNDSHK